MQNDIVYSLWNIQLFISSSVQINIVYIKISLIFPNVCSSLIGKVVADIKEVIAEI